MNMGMARYWTLMNTPKGPIVVEYSDTPSEPVVGLEVLDRGPINLWTGKPHA